jgi:hypothetical protein
MSDKWNDTEILKLREGMSRIGYKVKFCPWSGLIQLFKKDITFDLGYDPTDIQYLFIEPYLLDRVRKNKRLKNTFMRPGTEDVTFGNERGTIGYKPTASCRIYTTKGTATVYSNVIYTNRPDKLQPLNIIDGSIILDSTNVWTMPNGEIIQFKNIGNGKYKLVKINKDVDLIKTNLKFNEGLIYPILMSVNPVNMITFTVEGEMYFIQKHKLVGFSRHSLRIDSGSDDKPDINDYWFAIPKSSVFSNRPKIQLYNMATGEVADNIIFEKYETIVKRRGEVFTADGVTYPDSIYDAHLYKINIEFGASLYFVKEESNLIVYISPQSNGRFTKPASRRAANDAYDD